MVEWKQHQGKIIIGILALAFTGLGTLVPGGQLPLADVTGGLFERFQAAEEEDDMTEVHAAIWRTLVQNAINGTNITPDTTDCLVNGKAIADPTAGAGYAEFATPIFTGDHVQLQVIEAGYYTRVTEFTVPELRPLEGGQTHYVLHTVDMLGLKTTDGTLGATYGQTDIDAADWDIDASSEYSAVEVGLDISMSTMDNLAWGPVKYTELTGDKDTFSKFIHFDFNDSDIILKDVKLEGTPLKAVWSEQSAGSDFQVIYEFEQVLINDGAVSGDGKYTFTFTIQFGDEENEMVVNLYDIVDVENGAMGSPGTVDETVTVNTT
jgi:hypothetical protein